MSYTCLPAGREQSDVTHVSELILSEANDLMNTLLKNTQSYLKSKGLQNSVPEAELILSHILNCRKIDLYTQKVTLDKFQQEVLDNILQQRTSGEPLQYLLGEVEFYGFNFKVQRGVFIPRPETELLVETVIKKLSANRLPLTANLLDLCTGSGNIAISLTKTMPQYKMFASDISKTALQVACENAELNNINNSIEFRCGDLFMPWQDKKGCFDAIVCNPPYIKTQALNALGQDVKSEPVEALDAGCDGLKFYKRILEEAPLFLKPKAWIFFEIAPDVTEEVAKLLCKDFFNIEIVKDYNGLERIISAQAQLRG